MTKLLQARLISTALLALCVTANAKPFRSKSGYAIEAPRGWKVTPNFSAADVLLQAPRNKATINVTFWPIRKGETLQSGGHDIDAAILRMKNAKIMGRKRTKLDGVATVVHEYAYNSPHNGRMRVGQTTAIRAGRAVLVTAMAPEKIWPRVGPTMLQTIEPFRWNKK
jgi:hypothetical protein